MWQSIIQELQGKGFTQSKLAGRAGCSQSTIHSIGCGETKDPRFSIGQALLVMHEKHCKPRRTKANAAEAA